MTLDSHDTPRLNCFIHPPTSADPYLACVSKARPRGLSMVPFPRAHDDSCAGPVFPDRVPRAGFRPFPGVARWSSAILYFAIVAIWAPGVLMPRWLRPGRRHAGSRSPSTSDASPRSTRRGRHRNRWTRDPGEISSPPGDRARVMVRGRGHLEPEDAAERPAPNFQKNIKARRRMLGTPWWRLTWIAFR